jgi:hypothetical protein
MFFQGIVPESTLETVKELFVPDYLQEHARKETEQLPVLDITEVCNEWKLSINKYSTIFM